MRIIVLPVEGSERPGVSHNGYPAVLCDKAEIYLDGSGPVRVNVAKDQFLRYDLSRYPEGQSDICPYCGTPNEQGGVSLRNGHDCYYCGSN